MTKTDGKFTQDRQPEFKNRAARGPDKRTLILEALKQSGRLTLPEDASNADVERAWFAKIAAVALDDEHKDSGMCKQALLDRGWAKAKPEAIPTQFRFDVNATPTENATAIMLDASEAQISTEEAKDLIGVLKDINQIHEQTELVERLERIEKELNKGA